MGCRARWAHPFGIGFRSRYVEFGRDDGHSVSIILPDGNQKIKEVKVLGETAKAVTYIDHFSDDSLSNIVSGLPYRGGANLRGF